MTHNTPATAFVAGVPGPGKTTYRLRGDKRPGFQPGSPGTFESLTDAMDASGHLINCHWFTEPGQPDRLFLGDPLNGYLTPDPTGPVWTIEAAGVAREYADSIPAVARFSRTWSPYDEQIIAAVADACASSATGWPLDASARVRAGIRLAAWFATSRDGRGSLTVAEVSTVIDDAYFAAYVDRDVPPSVIDKITAEVGRRLAAARISVTGLGTTPASHFVRFADKLGTAEGRFHQWLRRLWRPVWVVRVPAGRLPARPCLVVSYLISHIIIPFGVIGGGFWLTWRLSFPGWRGTWRGIWYGGVQTGHPQGAWHPTWWAIPLWLAVSYLAGCAVEKLVNVELRPRSAKMP